MKMEQLREIIKHPRGKVICIDVDGTLCRGEFWRLDEEPEPIPEMIAKVQKWYFGGAHIIIYTARRPALYPQTMAWLIKHEVPFHGICMTYKPCLLYTSPSPRHRQKY